MAKIRVYELAKELGKDNKEMENLIRGLGVEIKGVMSTLDDDQAQAVRRHISSGSSPRREPERRGPPASPTSPSSVGPPSPAQAPAAAVIRRRGVGPRPTDDEDMAPPPPPARPERPSFDRPAYSERPVMAERPFVAERPQATQGSQGLSMERPAERPQVAPAPVVRRPVVAPAPSVQQPTASAMPVAQDSSRPEPVREPDTQPEPARPVAEVRPEPPRPAVAPTPPVAPQRPIVTQPQRPMVTQQQRPMGTQQQRPGAPQQRPSAPPRAPEPPEPKPAVGSRIQLPANTRRLPGGIAARMDEPTPGRGDRDHHAPRHEHHDTRGERGPRGEPAPSPVGQPLKPGVQTRPGPGRPGATGITGTRPLQTTGPNKLPERPGMPQGTPVRSVEVPARPGPAMARGQVPAPPPAPVARATTPPTVETDVETGRRVVRNESGVIVGAASQRAEPKIVGFIPLANRARPQQVIITDASEVEQRGRATVRKQREERAQAQGRRRKMTVRNMRGRGGALSPRVTTQEMSDAKKRIRVDEVIQIAEMAHQMGKKATAVLRVLWGMGMRGLTLNNVIDFDTAELVAGEFGYTIDNVAFQEDEFIDGLDEGSGVWRAPVVTIMGHVDHGKTSLLDKIRKAAVAEGEAGGITQHIGAYKVSTAKGDVVFLDTPGHEAFSAMRTRGAQVTDVVVLVVAADDGIMPTTIEAIKHARDANVPIVVALNKIDKPDANPGRVKQMLMEYSLVGEEFGGETIICEVSAKTGKGIDTLLEMLALQTEILDLRATTEGRAQGVVLEARVDKGRGPIATVLVEAGTLVKGDIVVANEYSGKVRGILDDKGKALDSVGPSTPVELLGLDGVPSAGDRFNVVESEKAARQLVTHRRETRRRKESVRSGPSIQDFIQRKKTPTLKIVMRADVQGSAEALKQALLDLSTDKVKVEVIFAGVGAITQTDVKTASAGDAVIIGFNTKPVGRAAPTSEMEKVPIFVFNVIYDALDKTRELMLGMLEPEYREREQGEAEVRALFPIPRVGVVAGCRVQRGLIQRSSHVRVVRGKTVIFRGKIQSLRVLKEDVKEVREGFECGIVVENFPEIEPGDIIQAFDMETIAPTL